MKQCNRCKKNSYSSFEDNLLDCPSCSADLTGINKYKAIPTLKKQKINFGKRTLHLTLKDSNFNKIV
jgi:ribosomal protein L37AE/L43A